MKLYYLGDCLMKLIYGTTNKAKLNFMKRHTEPLGINILSLDEVNAPKLDIDECGNTPIENAKIKALAYYNALQKPVFSCDSGLYIDGLDEKRQPGVNVRSVDGCYLNDDEAIAYFSSLADEFGGSLTARYHHAIFLVLDKSKIYEQTDINSEKFFIISKPHEKRNEGFPIDSLSIHIESGKYYYDLEDYAKKLAEGNDGFTEFFKRVLLDSTHKEV